MSVGTRDPVATYADYHFPPEHPPSSALGWNVYGAGIENIGQDGHPERLPVEPPARDQLLIRIDAVGSTNDVLQRAVAALGR